MMRKSWLLVSALSILLASGGVSYAAMIDMPLRDNVGIKDVSGGEKSNPLWGSELGNDAFRGALKNSLNASGLLERAKGEGRYVLSAVLESLDYPNVGLLSVITHVRYTLTDKKSGKEVYQESIAGEYTAQVWDSLLSPKILREASERATRANTGRLTQKLIQLSPSREEVSLLR